MPPDNDELDEVLEMVSVLMRDGHLPSSNMADRMKAEDEKDPVKESQEQMTSCENLTLETLPNEIISSIAGMLAVGIDVPFVVTRPHLTTPENRKQDDANARRDLTSLCMVSKRMASNAQKALYRNILIANANTLILLHRTFLENSKLGIQVKRMSLNIDHGWDPGSSSDDSEDEGRFLNGKPIDLSPLLSCAQHGLGEQFPKVVQDSRRARRKIPVEIFFTLQFRVLSHTSNLELLDVNVHPFLDFIRKYTKQQMKERHWEEVGAVLCSLWEEVLPCLSSVKKLQIIGYHDPLEEEPALVPQDLFSARICRCFLKLPNLERIAWANHTALCAGKLPFLTVSGIDTESRFESVQVLVLDESACHPQDLNTICFAFPNLQSLSVDNGRHQFPCFGIASSRRRANEDLTPNTGGRYLSDSLAALKNLKTLRLDLHYHHEISQTLGPLGALSLVRLANLETLQMPFHFFARSVLPEGFHEVVSPESTLPRTLKTLKIMACYECDDFDLFYGTEAIRAADRYWRPPCHHGDAVLQFLEMLASFRDEYFPSLEHVCYEEAQLDEDQYDKCHICRRMVHLRNSNDRDTEQRLEEVEELLLQKGVVFENHSYLFDCTV